MTVIFRTLKVVDPGPLRHYANEYVSKLYFCVTCVSSSNLCYPVFKLFCVASLSL